MYIPPQNLEPTKILAGCVAVFENVWPDYEQTVDLIEEVTNDESSGVVFERATTLEDDLSLSISSGRTNKHLSLSENAYKNETIRQINNRLFDLTYAAVSWYKSHFAIRENINWVEPLVLLRYQIGEKYNAHYDGPTSTHRCVSPILYLNDDYEGGELEFVNFNLKIKSTPGTLLLFPANYAYRHIAHPVISGTKFAMVTFLHDQPGKL